MPCGGGADVLDTVTGEVCQWRAVEQGSFDGFGGGLRPAELHGPGEPLNEGVSFLVSSRNILLAGSGGQGYDQRAPLTGAQCRALTHLPEEAQSRRV